MQRSVGLAVVLATIGLAEVYVTAQTHVSTRDGVYTERQADQGAAAYAKACASCHGKTLEGSGAATPPLMGSDFTMNWNGQPLDELFERIQTSMPADHPGTLSRAENAGILAYILKMNQLPAGKQDLPSEAEALKQIQFEAAKQ